MNRQVLDPDNISHGFSLGWAALSLAFLFGLQAWVSVHWIGADTLRQAHPIVEDDYSLHLAGAEAVRQSGRLHGYNAGQMAGHPFGGLDSPSNQLLRVAVWVLRPERSESVMNGLLFALFCSPPLLGWMAARQLRFLPVECFATSAAFLLLFGSWVEGPRPYLNGMYSFAVALPLAIALLAVASGWWRRRSRLSAVGLAVGLTVGILLHPYLLILTGPGLLAGAAYLWNRERPSALFLLSALGLGAVANLWWIVPTLLEARRWGRATALFFQDTLDALAAELTTPTAILWAVGLLGIWRWWSNSRRLEATVFGTTAAVLGILGGFGELVPAVAPMEPARFLDAFTITLLLPAVESMSSWWQRGSQKRWLAVALAFSIFVLPAATTVQSLLGHHRLLTWTGSDSDDGRLQRDVVELVTWLKENTTPEARLLMEDSDHDKTGHRYGDSHLLALLPYWLHREVIGGPMKESRLVHHVASFVEGQAFGRDLETLTDESLLGYLELYNVGWIVAWSPAATRGLATRPWLDLLRDEHGYRVFEVQRTLSFAESNPATEVLASIDRIRVTGAPQGETVVRYHWDPRVRSVPRLPIRRVERLDDPVGFLAIDNGDVTEFELRFDG